MGRTIDPSANQEQCQDDGHGQDNDESTEGQDSEASTDPDDETNRGMSGCSNNNEQSGNGADDSEGINGSEGEADQDSDHADETSAPGTETDSVLAVSGNRFMASNLEATSPAPPPHGDPGRCGSVIDASTSPAELAQQDAEWEIIVREAASVAARAGKLPRLRAGYPERDRRVAAGLARRASSVR